MTLSTPLLRPDPDWRVDGLLTLRDAEGQPADDFDSSRLALDVSGARLSASLAREQAGLYSFQLSGLPGTGQGTARVTLRFDGEVLLDRELPVAVDHAVVAEGVRARGGCSIVGVSDCGGSAAWLALVACWAQRRIRRRAALLWEAKSGGAQRRAAPGTGGYARAEGSGHRRAR
jgi:hypothetical protein